MRDKFFKFRLTTHDKKILKEIAEKNGVSASSYLRNVIINEIRIFTLEKEQYRELKEEFGNLTRIGSNLNQIARYFNERNLAGLANDITKEKEMNLVEWLAITYKITKEAKERIVDLCNSKKIH